MVVDSFAGQTLKQKDVLTKKYSYFSWALVNLVSKANKTFRARLVQNSDGAAASTSLEIPHKDLVLRPKIRSSGDCRCSLDYAVDSKLKLKGEVNAKATSSQLEGSVSAELVQPQLRAKASLKYPAAAQLTATAESGEWVAGFDFKYDHATQRLVTYDLLCGFNRNNCRLVFKHVGLDKSQYAMGDWVYSYYQKVSEKTVLAACVTVNWPTKATYIEFGGVYQQAPDLELRAKADSKGLIAAGLTHTASKELKLSVAAQVDAKKAAQAGVSDYLLGVRLDFAV